jgi:hypothetical protein
MRKGLTFRLSTLLCAGALIAPSAFAAEKFEITANEIFDPFGYLGSGEVGLFLAPPTVKCPGYEPTGNPAMPCPEGSRQHSRDGVWVSRIESMDPALSGNMTVVLNANLGADGAGPVWGTFSIVLDAGGTWEGTYQGLRVAEEGYWTATLHAVGRGNGGSVDGMRLMIEDEIWTPFTPPIAYLGTITGRIVDPNK